MKFLLIGLWVTLLAAALWLAVLPVPLRTGPYADEMFHIVACCVVMLLPACLFADARRIVISFLLLMIAGICLELYQGFMLPLRDVSLLDFLCNLIGAGFGIGIGWLLRRGYYA